ncbi:MAG: penicillin acylase family protein [Proteobacteria bacterium]|nr:penicillin acylase family protein [Pseudomonadota bacterium]
MIKSIVTLFVLTFTATWSLAENQSYTVDGLEQPAEIIVDEWGVPHIYASTHYDTFFVQGFNAARDRLWQIDTWRRRGLGQLSEVFGEQYLQQDRASRLFLYRGDMYREWLAYGSDAKLIAGAFTSGINAYIDQIAEHPDLLPPEFELLNYSPARWSPEDVVRIRGHGLWGNVAREVERALIVCKSDLETAAYWQTLEPEWKTVVPTGLDPCLIPADVLDNYYLAKAQVRFDQPSMALTDSMVTSSDRSLGSNNWVVAPSRTRTGRPVLADDPHRTHAVPSLRYIAHLVGPGLNVIGAGEPGLPGISIGHNDRIAFGLTIFPIDQEDLYVYVKVDGGYRYQDGVKPFQTVIEEFEVRGRDDVDIELTYSHHGPIVYETETHAFAVRAAWLEPGMAPYFGSVEYMRASDWREFLAALNRWGAPPENQVFADVEGNIGYKPAGLFPRRIGWDGLLPVPGDGRYEWQGFFDMDVLPVEFNPGRGFTGTANSMNLPDDYPISRYPVGFEWSTPWRYRRLWQVLQQQDDHSVGDSAALQRDYRSLFALEAVSRIPDGIGGAGAEILRAWDGELGPDSSAGAFFAVWYYRHLQPALATVLLSEEPQLVAGMDTLGALRLMSEERSHKAIALSLDSAYAETLYLLGENAQEWRWGDLHQIQFEHPLQHAAANELAATMRFPAYPRGGSGNTTNATGFSASDLLVRAGASYRQVIDVGNWDAATMTNAPGQSGDPRSPFYGNLLKDWAEERSFPLIYSRERVLEHEVFRIKLQPN